MKIIQSKHIMKIKFIIYGIFTLVVAIVSQIIEAFR